MSVRLLARRTHRGHGDHLCCWAGPHDMISRQAPSADSKLRPPAAALHAILNTQKGPCKSSNQQLMQLRQQWAAEQRSLWPTRLQHCRGVVVPCRLGHAWCASCAMLTARTRPCTSPAALQAQPDAETLQASPRGHTLPAAHTVLQALRRGHNSSWSSCPSRPAPPTTKAMLRWSRVNHALSAKPAGSSAACWRCFTQVLPGRGAACTQAWHSLALQYSARMLGLCR